MKSSTVVRRSPRPPFATPDPVYREVPPALLDLSHRAPRLAQARAADHAAIHRLLLGIFRGPSPAEFQAQQDEPLYEPSDRLVVKTGDDVVAHLRLSKRVLRFGPLEIAAVGVMDLATAPEYRGNGFASAMLASAERVAQRDGALLGMTRTRAVALFARQGWTPCGRHASSTAGARQILAQIGETAAAGQDDESPLAMHLPRPAAIHVRPLRRIELPAVMSLYEQRSREGWGWPLRSADYWDWLLHRSAFDAAYVATAGPDRLDLSKPAPEIAGYAFLKEGRIVELLTAPAAEGAASRMLLARVCRDAMERNVSDIRLDAPPHESLHDLLVSAGGRLQVSEECGNEVWMAKLFDPAKFVPLLAPLLLARAKAAGLEIPLQLGLCLQDNCRPNELPATSLRLVLGPRSVKLVAGAPLRSHLALCQRDLTALLLGHWSLADIVARGRIRASTQLALHLGSALFPALPFWHPPLDELLA